MSEMRGFASAQRQWENMEPSYAVECECPPLMACTECGETVTDGVCPEPDCAGGGIETVEREHDSSENTVASCPVHGWCTGCSSRNCEDCNG